MYEIGLSITGGKLHIDGDVHRLNEEFFANCAKADIRNIEISYGIVAPYYELDHIALKKMADSYGVRLWSYHLPFKPYDIVDISSSDKAVKKTSLDTLSELIKKAGDIGIDKYVIHSSCTFKREEVGKDFVRERLENAKESLARLADVAESAGGVMAVENLPPICCPTDYTEHLELLSADDRLRACFDTNHIVGGDPAEHIRALGERLITLHVSDYDLIFEKHWFPGEGKINWNEIVDALSDINYKGIWLYEVAFGCLSTLPYTRRSLTCEDFVRNAKEIFEKKPITKIL